MKYVSTVVGALLLVIGLGLLGFVVAASYPFSKGGRRETFCRKLAIMTPFVAVQVIIWATVLGFAGYGSLSMMLVVTYLGLLAVSLAAGFVAKREERKRKGRTVCKNGNSR